MKLEGRRILVTGASSGIGLETCRLFATEGARLAMLARDATRLETALATLATPESHVAISGDARDSDAVAKMVAESAAQLGGLDGVVHSAGEDLIAPFADTSLGAWQNILDANLTSTFLVCQESVPHLRANGGGTIVTLASGGALSPLPGRTAYCAAKAGVVMLSKTLALELAADNIRVNALCPGAIDTPMLRASAGGAHGDAMPPEIVARFAMGRVGEPDEIARSVLYLTSDDSSFVTGIALAADGGRTFH
ncbi:MAG: SDR family oxidoreductase [Chromatiales bacterium]|jgi:NAD(P)-dependent dehydrogenase (short-subunit alcohol dehydrogenase family)|nr:SDR family oxidoreductase [Chromatiales bacterium]